ncbi:hypothetical protein FNV43_RR07462 [Rhamnella rubrinervis]|uniref:GDSL esterase/lipase n=1 Tax=Rhamnella rubrinervis TaxID=2594499 RepID=A0A8K0HEU8_9ROSA|nr:hypothetical protein FNV43_RR07462 [Rhamnella rubrinervis]
MDSQMNIWFCALVSLSVLCYFIFGDSLADAGNNNPLSTFAKANYPPYGIDFPKRTSTGRFCNGRTSADIIGQLLGFTSFIPPFTVASGSSILQGVNYASASAGIRAETGTHLGKNIGLDGQLKNHRAMVSRITALLKTPKAAKAHLSKCIYYVGAGKLIDTSSWTSSTVDSELRFESYGQEKTVAKS